MFNSIPDEILLEIIKYLKDNRSVINFLKTCKYIKNLLYKNGYLKQINLDPLINNDPYKFAISCCKHSTSLNCICVRGLNNPQHWIFIWPRIVYITSCFISDEIKPPKKVNTEIMYVVSIRSNKKVHIDWKQFPKLKELHISYNIDISGIPHSCIAHIE